MSTLIGQSLGHYHILEQLGEGGMATVYKAYDTHLERNVAVKVIRTDQFMKSMLDTILQRFDREAKVLAKLSHPNIVGIMDYGEHEGAPFLVMEFLPGGTLKHRLGSPIPCDQAVRFLLPIARALDFAHRQGIVHRDVKPANILITSDGDAMLTDFGITKILENPEGATLTGTGTTIGTPEYMAPEQWMGKGTPSVDIYSLGVVLYEMVTGQKPYTADTPAAVLLKQANDPLVSPKQIVPSLPDPLEQVLLKALAKDPQDRYQGMADFVVALEKCLAATTQEGSKTHPELPTPGQAPTMLASPAARAAIPTPAPAYTPASIPVPAQRGTIAPPAEPPKKNRLWLWLLLGGGGLFLLIACLVVVVLLGKPVVESLFFQPTATATLRPQPTRTLAPVATQTSVVIPTKVPPVTVFQEGLPGLAGVWRDTAEGTDHTIAWIGNTYTVVSSINDERGVYSILSEDWDGYSFTFVYRVPEGADVTIEAYLVDGDSLYVNWSSTNGNSGEDVFTWVGEVSSSGDMLGDWELYYNWDCGSNYGGPVTVSFYSDGTYYAAEDTGGGYGTWTLVGSLLDYIYDESPYAHYVGTINSSFDYGEGTMSTSDASNGCWYAYKK